MITKTILYHFVRAIADQWNQHKGGHYSTIGDRERIAVFLMEALVATLDRIESQEAIQERIGEHQETVSK